MSRRVSNEPDLEVQTGVGLIVPLDLIRVDEGDNQRRYSPKAEEIKGLAESILKRGLINPLTVRELSPEEKNGGVEQYKLVAGYQRIKALAYLNQNGHDFYSVEVKVRHHVAPAAEGEPVVSEHVQDILLNIDENERRKNLGVIDRAVAARTLTSAVEEGGAGMTQAVAANAMGTKQAAISQLLSILTLRPEVQKKINAGVIPFTVARDFPNIPEDEQDRLIAEAEAGGGVVSKAATTAAREAKGKVKSKAGRKSKSDEASGPKGVSAKAAQAMIVDLVKEIQGGDGKRTKTELAAVEVMTVFGDYLGGKFGGKALKNRVLAAVG